MGFAGFGSSLGSSASRFSTCRGATRPAGGNRPQPIGFRATISAPHMHAHALEVLSPVIPENGARVLDVGCGSGYLTGEFGLETAKTSLQSR